MNSYADMIADYEAGIANIDRKIKQLRRKKDPYLLQRIYDLEASRGNMIYALNALRGYDK